MRKYFKRGLSTSKTMKYVGVINKTRKFLTILAVFGMIWSYVPWKQIQAEVVGDETVISEDSVSKSIVKKNGRDTYVTTDDGELDVLDIPYEGEVVELRTNDSKTFLKTDGSYEVSIYDQSIHYLENDEYKEINNSLIDSNNDVENLNNVFKIKMPKKLHDNKHFQYRIDDYKIDWTISDINRSNAQYSVEENTKQNMTDVINLKQLVLYPMVQDGVSLEYVLNGVNVKENIILDYYKENFNMTFIYKTENVELIQNENEEYIFVNENYEEIVRFSNLVMYDSKGNYSSDIVLSVVKTKENEYEVNLSPSNDFLMNASYPVVVDPNLEYVSSTGLTYEDTYYFSTTGDILDYDTTKHYTENTMKIGSYTTFTGEACEFTNYSYSGLINMTLPSTVRTKQINYAYLMLNEKRYDGSDAVVIYENNQSFDITSYVGTMTPPSYNDKAIDIAFESAKDNTTMFDITSSVKKWQKLGLTELPGFTLKKSTESNDDNLVEYYTKDESSSVKRPVIIFGVSNAQGVKDYWTYNNYEVPGAGSVMVSDHTGFMTLSRNDLTFKTEKQSLSFGMVYDVNRFNSTDQFGKGWRPNYDMERGYDSDFDAYYFVDASGNETYYHPLDICDDYHDSIQGVSYNCYLTEDGSGNVYIIENTSYGSPYTYILTPSHIKYTFNVNGYLVSIIDKKTDLIIIINRFEYYNRRIESIVDSTGNKIELHYDGDMDYAELKTKQSANDWYTLERLEYTYIRGSLVEVRRYGAYTDNDNNDVRDENDLVLMSTVRYKYNGSNILYSIENIDSNDKIELDYNLDDTINEINFYKMTDNSTEQILGTVNYDYSNGYTKISDQEDNWISYYFDNYGHTVTTIDSYGKVDHVQYLHVLSNGLDEPNWNYNHKVISSSDAHSIEENMIKNPGFKNTLDWEVTEFVGYQGRLPVFSSSSFKHYTGSTSGKLTNSDNLSNVYVSQDVILDKGTYTLSAYVLTGFVNNVKLEVVCNSQNQSVTNANQDNYKWTRIQMTFNVMTDNTSCKVKIHNLSSTSIYFDNVQLSYGYNKIGRNVLENSSFEQGLNKWEITENVYQSELPESLSIYSSLLGDKVMMFDNDSIGNLYATIGLTEIDYDDVEGKTFSIGAFAGVLNSSSVDNSIYDKEINEQHFEMHVYFLDRYVALGVQSYSDYVLAGDYLKFDSSVEGLQYNMKEFTTPENTKYILVTFTYKGLGKVFVDHVQVYENQVFTQRSYNDYGKLTSEVKSSGERTEYHYDNTVSINTPVTTTTYDANNKVVSSTASVLDENNLVKEVNNNGVYMNVSRNEYGQVVELKVGKDANYTMSTSYDLLFSQYVSAKTNEFGSSVEYEYDYLTGLIQNSKDLAGNNTEYYYYDNGDRIDVVNSNYCEVPEGSTLEECVNVSYLYNQGVLQEIKMTEDFSYVLTYDEFGRTKSIKWKNGNDSNDLMSYVYEGVDSNGYLSSNMTEQHYGNGNELHFQYNEDDQVIYIGYKEFSDGTEVPKFEYEYDSEGRVITIKHFGLNSEIIGSESIDYDSIGNVKRIHDVYGNIIDYDYNLENSLSVITVVVEDNSETVNYEYKSDKYIYQNLMQDDLATIVTYNNYQLSEKLVNDVEITDDYISMTITDNQFGLVGNLIPSSVGDYEFSVNYLENSSSVGFKVFEFNEDFDIINYSSLIGTDLETGTGTKTGTFSVYDSNTKYIAVVFFTNSSSAFIKYDLVTLDYLGTQEISLYDQTTFDNIAKKYIYENDPFYRLTTIQTVNGTNIMNKTYEYSGNTSRVTNISYSVSNRKLEYKYLYDVMGNISSVTKRMTNSSGVIITTHNEKYTYDELNQLSSETVNDMSGNCSTVTETCFTKYYKYDLRGNITDVKVYPMGEQELIDQTIPGTYFINNGREDIYYVVTGETEIPVGGTVNLTFDYFLQDNQMPANPVPFSLTENYVNNGALFNQPGYYLVTGHVYDRIHIYDLEFSVLITVGNPQPISNTPHEHMRYNYNNQWLDQLSSISTITYDSNGNELTSTITQSYSYDGQGNPLEITNFIGNETATLSYEGRQLKTINVNLDEDSTIEEISYVYNDQGHRIAKTVDFVTTTYTLSGDKVIYETDGTNEIYYRYDYDGTLISMNLNGVEYFYIHNQQGDITQILDSNFNIVVEYTYDAWGNIIELIDNSTQNIGQINPYTYRGYRYDHETNLYYLNSRYYSPSTMRFLNADGLLGQQGSILGHNMYAYTQNNPVMYTDISGEFPILITAALIGFVVGGGIGALISYNDNGVVNASDIFLYAALGTAVGLTAGAAWEMFTAYQIASVTAELTFVASMDGDPTNEIVVIGEYISNTNLSNIYQQFYKGAFTSSPIGEGNTADAIRYTQDTGILVGGSNHLQKGFDLLNGVSRLINSGTLNRYDCSVAYDIFYKLKDVLGG